MSDSPEPAPVPEHEEDAQAREARIGRLGRRVVFGLFFGLATAFILSSTFQITRAVFFPN